VKTANRVLGMIMRSFSYLSKAIALHLYKTWVRSHLEYCLQAWRLIWKKDIELMEGFKGEQQNWCSSMRNYSYEEILKFFNLTTLETKRIRGDLIGLFKILKGYEDLNAQTFFLNYRR
jgi:ribonucleases P/MRP protein subunit RPP40